MYADWNERGDYQRDQKPVEAKYRDRIREFFPEVHVQQVIVEYGNAENPRRENSCIALLSNKQAVLFEYDPGKHSASMSAPFDWEEHGYRQSQTRTQQI